MPPGPSTSSLLQRSLSSSTLHLKIDTAVPDAIPTAVTKVKMKLYWLSLDAHMQKK